jgi:hypothetical protein
MIRRPSPLAVATLALLIAASAAATPTLPPAPPHVTASLAAKLALHPALAAAVANAKPTVVAGLVAAKRLAPPAGCSDRAEPTAKPSSTVSSLALVAPLAPRPRFTSAAWHAARVYAAAAAPTATSPPAAPIASATELANHKVAGTGPYATRGLAEPLAP